MDADTYKELFRTTYMKLLGEGMAPDEALAKTLQDLQHVTPSVDTQRAGVDDDKGDPGNHDERVEVGVEVKMDVTTEDMGQQDDEARDQLVDGDVEMGERVSLVEEVTPTPAHILPSPPPPPAPTTVQPPPPPRPMPLGAQLKAALYAAAETDQYREVKTLLYQIFSDISMLNGAFVTEDSECMIDPAEEWWQVDRNELQEVYALLVDAVGRLSDPTPLQNTWRNALEMMVTQPWNVCSSWTRPEQLRFILVLFEHPMLFDPDYLNVTGGVCKLFFHLSEPAKELVRYQWRTYYSNDELYRLLQILQQSITVCLYGSRKMDLVYAACAVLQELHTISTTRPPAFATYDEFYNDAVNSEVDIVHDYSRSLFFHKRRQELGAIDDPHQPHRMLSEMSFCDFPFVLDAASKSRVLNVDSDLEQRSRLQDAMMSRFTPGASSPYLILKVRREHVIEDALQQLVRASAETLKKPLKVKFVGEEGIDEGGVRKEFFQILIRQLLDPAFGMFTYDQEQHTMWFAVDSLEATMEFELIGILLGLAIYNAVILDLHFPHIVYKKLMECPLGLEDVETAMPSLGKGLRQLLDFDGNVEEVYQRNFEYSYESFGEVKTVELKPGGSTIPVTNENRAEYVSLYVDYILNGSVARQYDAFHKGFHLVCNGGVLQMFRWEELQLLVCGSTELDFEALEKATHYDDGFTEESECIKNFWSVVHEFSLEEKKKLLMFSTGSDRVPIRGLSNLVFVISRNGPDSDRLPTAHTCFNHLLLPDYSTREKLKERLLLAINQAEGFGLR